ncbi:hypothetical protein AWU67_13520 [Microterricola viridarii]|uniref:Uncharacterized protein n=1 Tax=Microterricola viridarii TaxID=412690 RepID=A0A0X8E550_9MICO|nr:hypothetical protein AWU67_13520 [Microterricola viridarii]
MESLTSEEIALIASAQAAAQRTARGSAYRQGREHVARLDEGGTVAARIEESFLSAVRESGFTGEKVRAQSATRWAGLAAAFRAELSSDECEALESAWKAGLAQAASELVAAG